MSSTETNTQDMPTSNVVDISTHPKARWNRENPFGENEGGAGCQCGCYLFAVKIKEDSSAVLMCSNCYTEIDSIKVTLEE